MLCKYRCRTIQQHDGCLLWWPLLWWPLPWWPLPWPCVRRACISPLCSDPAPSYSCLHARSLIQHLERPPSAKPPLPLRFRAALILALSLTRSGSTSGESNPTDRQIAHTHLDWLTLCPFYVTGKEEQGQWKPAAIITEISCYCGLVCSAEHIVFVHFAAA